MRETVYLILTRNGITGMRKTQPPRSRLAAAERVVKLTVEVPAAAFDSPPVPEALLIVPEEALISPMPMPVEITLGGPEDAS